MNALNQNGRAGIIVIIRGVKMPVVGVEKNLTERLRPDVFDL